MEKFIENTVFEDKLIKCLYSQISKKNFYFFNNQLWVTDEKNLFWFFYLNLNCSEVWVNYPKVSYMTRIFTMSDFDREKILFKFLKNLYRKTKNCNFSDENNINVYKLQITDFSTNFYKAIYGGKLLTCQEFLLGSGSATSSRTW
jgi:hypothetical protein